MGSTWAEHRVFALSMQVYGNVNKYVINMLGKAVIVEDTEKRSLKLLPEDHWKRYFIPFDESVSFFSFSSLSLSLYIYIYMLLIHIGWTFFWINLY
jgi:hypothetical protein